MKVTNSQELTKRIDELRKAQKEFTKFTQEQVDDILEAYVSVLASEYTNGLALESIRLIFKYLPDSYNGGTTNIKAREKMAHASSIAGMAFANAFLGICHSMAHKLGAFHHVPHGIANALLIDEVIRFNATDAPRKQAAFPQYKYPNAGWRYARIADYLNLGGNTEEEKIELLIKAIDDLKKKIGIPNRNKHLEKRNEKVS